MTSCIDLLVLRQSGLLNSKAVRDELSMSAECLKQLNCVKVLHGHQGCVNRMAWNRDGSNLVSGSDDRKIIIWPTPASCMNAVGSAIPSIHQPATLVETRHASIIFGVQFLPQSNDARLVSGGMDMSVQLHEIPPAGLEQTPRIYQDDLAAAGRAAAAGLKPVQPKTTVYPCHTGRVKDVEVEPMNPHLFWSAAEDGTVRQYDTRVSTSNQNTPRSSNVLIGLRGIEVKGLDVCKAHPHLLAVACEDPFVRVYDRRKLSLSSEQAMASSTASDTAGFIGQPVLMLAPAHRYTSKHRTGRAHTTYASFSNRGDRLVATYHGDQAYCFDVTSSGSMSTCYPAHPTQPTAYTQYSPRTVRQRCMSGYAAGNASMSEQELQHLRRAVNSHGSLHDVLVTANMVTLGALKRGGNATDRAPAGPETSTLHPDDIDTDIGVDAVSAALPAAASESRQAGNASMFESRWPEAVQHFSRAIHYAPWCASLWLRRADALLGRAWYGDAMYALHDADTALLLLHNEPSRQHPHSNAGSRRGDDDQHVGPSAAHAGASMCISRAHLTRAHALRAMKEYRAALQALDTLASIDAEVGGRYETRQLRAGIEDVLRKEREWQRKVRQRQKERARKAAAEDHSTTGPSSTANGASQDHPEDSARELPTPADGHASSMHDWPGRDAGMDNKSDSDSDDCEDSDDSPFLHYEHQFRQQRQHFLQHMWPGGRSHSDETDHGDDANDSDSDDSVSEQDDDTDRRPYKNGYVHEPHEAVLRKSRNRDGSSMRPHRKGRTSSTSFENQQHQADDGGALPIVDCMPGGRRLVQRYVGHTNLHTDIKECCFMGPNDSVVACCSDGGKVLLYEADSGRPFMALEADSDIVNCVQPHPEHCLLATSGIESSISLWAPSSDICSDVDVVSGAKKVVNNQADVDRIVTTDQARMKTQAMRMEAWEEMSDSPQLLRAILSSLNRRAGAAAAAAGGDDDDTATGGEEHDLLGDDDDIVLDFGGDGDDDGDDGERHTGGARGGDDELTHEGRTRHAVQCRMS